jgi:hypothetical protein
MKKLAIVGLLALGSFLAGCGATRTPTTAAAGGNWEVSFAGPPANETLFDFETTFSVNAGGGMSVSAVNFLTSSSDSCFPVTGVTASGAFDVTSLQSDPTATANVTFSVQNGGNALAMTGTATGVTNTVALTTVWNAVTGTWTLTGSSSCTGSGTFTMCPHGLTCSTT